MVNYRIIIRMMIKKGEKLYTINNNIKTANIYMTERKQIKYF